MHTGAYRWVRALALVGALLTAACGRGVDLPPADTNAPAPPQAPAAPPETATFSWGSGWEMRVRPVFSGIGLDAGTGTITVEEWQDGPRAVRYAFPAVSLASAPKEARAAAIGLLRPEPVEGRITVTPELAAEGRVLTPPAFWQDGDSAAPGPLIWFSRAVVEELRQSRTATVRIAPLANGLRMPGRATSEPDTVTLTVGGTTFAVVQVNGKPVRIPALELDDSRGGSYVLLNAPDNPLVVRFRFGAKSVVAGKTIEASSGGGYDVTALRHADDAPTSPTRP